MNHPVRGMRVALAGCGRMGRTRAGAVRELGGTVVAVYDPDPEAARSSGPSARLVRDPRELLDDAPDALFVCTPPSQRGPLEHACTRAGVPFFVEKPIGLSARVGEELLQELAGRSLVTAVGYMNRYRSSVEEVRHELRRSPPLAIHGTWMCGPYAKDWWHDPGGSGGPLNEQATHMVDLFRYLGGEIVEVGGMSDAAGGAATACAVSLRWKSGALGTFCYSCRAKEKNIFLDAVTPTRSFRLCGWDLHRPSEPVEADRNAIFLVETASFLEAVRTGVRSRVRSDLYDAVRTQRVVDALRRAVAESTIVTVDPGCRAPTPPGGTGGREG